MPVKRRKTWRCFHCDAVFRGRVRAELHFGLTQNAVPACLVSPAQFREMEVELARYRAEDHDLHRQIASVQGAHSAALRHAEETGYAKGLQDGRKLV